MAKELIFFKFNPGEWIKGDITLCSMTAQGVFINLCCYYWMKDCSISLANAKQRFSNDVASINELLQMGVFTIDENENIIIDFLDEQMNEFIDVSEKRSISGRLGGLAKAKQMLKFAKAKRSNKDKEEDKEKDKDIDYELIKNKYNESCTNLNKIDIISDARKKFIRARVNEFGIDKLFESFNIVAHSDFLNGRNGNSWKANFDWIIKPTNFIKIIEGNYANPKTRLS